MPLFHQAVAWSFRLNRQSIEHARLADGEIADVDHFLHFAFAFGDDFPGLERHQLAELMFQFAQRIAQAANSFTAHRSRRDTPLQKRFLRARDRSIVIFT